MGGNADRSRFLRALVAIFASWGVYFCVLWSRMLFETSDGLYAGWRTVWADWSAHFAYANVFAYRPVGEWFSSHPVFAGASFDYPFLADALSGLLMRVGLDRIGAFLLPSVVATLLLLVVLFVFYEQLLRSPKLAFLACTLFFTNGGLGFLRFARDLARDLDLKLLLLPPREYTYLPDLDIQWINIVSSELLPQRAFLLGLPLGLTLLIVLRRYVETGFAGVSRAKLCALGALPGVLVITHMHSLLALVLLCAMLLLFDRRNYPQWLVFTGASALPSVVLFARL